MKKVTVLFFSEPDQRSVSQPHRLSDRGVPDGGGIYNETKYGDGPRPTTAQPRKGRPAASPSLGWVATGDASVSAAKAAGGITTVASVDHWRRTSLGILGEWCTIVKAADHACCPSEEGSSGYARRPFFLFTHHGTLRRMWFPLFVIILPLRHSVPTVSICRRIR